MTQSKPLAHSGSDTGRAPHLYGDHIRDTVTQAEERARAVATFIPDPVVARHFVATVSDGATWHDLGKLDPDNQAALHQGRSGRLPWDHVDAGVAWLLRRQAMTAAWVVRGHHAPGLPARTAEFNSLLPAARKLRGGRVGARDGDAGDILTCRTNATLDHLLAAHAEAAGAQEPTAGPTRHGLFLRLALSCLVDADHSDTARHEHGRPHPTPPEPRWTERLAALDAFVAALAREGNRQNDRRAFYRACRHGPVGAPMLTCDGSVGIGKTTSGAALCLRRAIASGARRIFIVAPHTTILSQTARTLRAALTLPDEADREAEVVAEHHHRAEFSSLECRDLTTLWRAPVVVTTSVQFFETLASGAPARLRKLHGLPGSVVFLDEAHAALPAPLWRQNWAWMCELARDWGCSFVFASGSLARVWEDREIVGAGLATRLPDIAPPDLAERLRQAERARVHFHTLGRLPDPLRAILDKTGPRLVVVNTVQTAAVLAARLRAAGGDVLHLSTALCPTDRDRILAEVKRRLDPHTGYAPDWTLVATSLVEAGLDLSFRTGMRERFSVASLIQVGGRINRNGENASGEVFDFLLDADGLMTTHPDAARPGAVLGRFFASGKLSGDHDPASLVTEAIREELRDAQGRTGLELAEAERAGDHVEVSRLGRVIDVDTRLVVVDECLKARLLDGQIPPVRVLLAGSVKMWTKRIEDFRVEPFSARPDLYIWRGVYDPNFLGYMAAIFECSRDEACVENFKL